MAWRKKTCKFFKAHLKGNTTLAKSSQASKEHFGCRQKQLASWNDKIVRNLVARNPSR